MRDYFDVFRNLYFYLIVLVSAVAISYYAYERIETLPKPETFIELLKFYFKDPVNYAKITGMALVAGIVNLFLGIATVGNGIFYTNRETYWYSTPFTLFGVATVAAGVYFISYFGWLLFVVAAVGFAVFIAADRKNAR